jgi:hypothetical protein
MSELKPEQVERLKGISLEGDQIRELCRHPGFKVYLAKLEEIISDSKNTWLNGSEEDAKNARFEARGVKRALDELKKFMLSGDRAKQILVDSSVETDLSTPADSR